MKNQSVRLLYVSDNVMTNMSTMKEVMKDITRHVAEADNVISMKD